MKKHLLLKSALMLIALVVGYVAGQERYREWLFSSPQLTTDLVYGRAALPAGDSASLTLDLYQPHPDTLHSRPWIVMIHGGGFLDGDKADESYVLFCEHMARLGYVVASINYRLVRGAAGLPAAIHAAYEDARAAARYLAVHADSFRIDPGAMIVAGASAGGITALHVGYAEPADFAAFTDTSLYANRSWPEGSYTTLGIVNMCGGMVDTAWIEPGEPGVYSSHGTEDAIVPYTTFASRPEMSHFYGSALVHTSARSKGIHSVLETEVMGHCYTGTDEVRVQFLYETLTGASPVRRVRQERPEAAPAGRGKAILTGLGRSHSPPIGSMHTVQGRLIEGKRTPRPAAGAVVSGR
jgi:hypothetical protein